MPDYTAPFGVSIEKLRLQMKAMERVVAALPGVNDLNFEEIESAMASDLPPPLIENVSKGAQERWARTAAQRLKALATGEEPPEFR